MIVSHLNQLLEFINSKYQLESKPKNVGNNIKWWSEEEFLKILNFVKNEEDRKIFKFPFYTGIRQGEIFALDKSMIKSGSKDAHYIEVKEQLYLNNSGLQKIF